MLVVQKYGGTSVGTPERIQAVAERVHRFVERGDQVVVVVSAMSGETNRLLALADQLNANPSPRELDVLLSTGEQVTIALLSMALHKLNIDARSYTGKQVRILTDDAHGKARIKAIDDQAIRDDLEQGRVVVVAGFQGVDEKGSITFDIRNGRVTVDGIPVDLTAQEIAVLTYLVHNSGRLISRTELSEHIYEYDGDRDSNTIAVFVTRLRKKLGPELITTVRGRGYMIDAA